MRKYTVLLLIAAILTLTLLINAVPASDSDYPVMLDRIVDRIQRNLNSLDGHLQKAAQRVAAFNADEVNIRPYLSLVKSTAPYIVDCAFIDPRGILKVIEPPYSGSTGTDISNQEHVQQIIRTKQPVLSAPFVAVEGFWAVSMGYPVIAKNDYLGFVSVLIRPESMLNSIIENEIKGTPVDVWIMQPDGRIIYDKDTDEIGKNLFEDDLYKPFQGLLEAGRIIAAQDNGTSKYEFFAKGKKEVVKKNIFWKTIETYGRQWKIVLVTYTDESTGAKQEAADVDAKTIGQALKELAANSDFISSIENKDLNYLLNYYFYKFREKYPCYSIQWVDENSVNHIGYPLKNSLINYKFDASKGGRDADFAERVNSRAENTFEAPLFEGNVGYFHMVPVYKGEKYLGMVYYIRIKP